MGVLQAALFRLGGLETAAPWMQGPAFRRSAFVVVSAVAADLHAIGPNEMR
jgi:hypothetical protein